MQTTRRWQIALHIAPERLTMRGHLSGSPPVESHATVSSVRGALELLETWFALCPRAAIDVMVTSDAGVPEHHSTHSRHVALHFITAALESAFHDTRAPSRASTTMHD